MSRTTRGNVMVAIENIERGAVPLINKAAALARQRGVGVHLLHVIAIPYVASPRAGVSPRAALREVIREREARLEQLARKAKLRGLPLATTVVWDYPASDAIVRAVMKHRPALLVAGSQRHARLARAFLTNSDWELIRNCPCPLLVSKTTAIAPRPTVMACLDPFHAHAKPAGLDAEILAAAVALAGTARRVFAMHSHADPESLLVEGVQSVYWIPRPESELAAEDERRRKKLASEAQRAAIPRNNVVHVRGEPDEEIPRAAKRLRADIAVMGAVSRSALKRLFVGNTAERLLDKLSCDVLIVKPRRFATRVPRRQAQLMQYPPYPTM